MTKDLKKAYEEASRELAREMSRQLKGNALKDGWDSQVAMGLNVSYDSGVFETSHNPAHSTEVFDLEYGTESQSGKATIRRMYSSKEDLLNRFAVLFERAVFKK